MQQYVALLRGIAPSGRNMTNDRLRGVFERLGFEQVSSVLASGNIVFRTAETDVPGLEQRVEAALGADLGLASRTIVRTEAELRALLRSDPFAGLTHGPDCYLTATFLRNAARDVRVDASHLDPRTRVVRYDAPARAVLAVTVNSDPGAGPRFVTWLEASYGKDITTRSWLSVRRIVDRFDRGADA